MTIHTKEKSGDQIAAECRAEAVDLRLEAAKLMRLASKLDGNDIGMESHEAAAVRPFAEALLGLWGAEGSECAHGVGIEADCPGELIESKLDHADDERAECHWQPFRPALRKALDVLS